MWKWERGSTVPDLYQTSPYLTCISAGDLSPVVYAIDELEPVVPDVTPVPGAAFGVIALDRTVAWHADPAGLDVLERAAPSPISRQSLAQAHGDAIVSDLIARKWLQRPDQLCMEYVLTTAQIEVTAHCNWGCRFCPVSRDPKPSATMPMLLFDEILSKLAVHDAMRYVTFHFYNEPTLDRFFVDRVFALRAYGLRLRLFTNASHLSSEKIDALVRSDVLDVLVVNLPSLREDEFRELTQSRTHDKSIRSLDAAADAGLPVRIAVNACDEQSADRVARLRERYEPRGIPVNPTITSDRAGAVDGRYNQDIRIKGPLRGCGWPVNHAHFSVRGNMFICCNDYYQREVFGNIGSGSVDDIMTSQAAVRARRRVFGVAEAPDHFLCRSCHDQLKDFPLRQFRPLASFPVSAPRACKGREYA